MKDRRISELMVPYVRIDEPFTISVPTGSEVLTAYYTGEPKYLCLVVSMPLDKAALITHRYVLAGTGSLLSEGSSLHCRVLTNLGFGYLLFREVI